MRLIRQNGPAWEFTPDKKYGCWTHITRYGTVYTVRGDIRSWKPIWIGRLILDVGWVTAEAEIGAAELIFDNGGKYVFPR